MTLNLQYPKDLPLVSVCVPTYNGALYLKEALDSILEQTYTHLEVIISDDGSTDATIDMVNAFKKRVSIPCIVVHNPSKGMVANWNHCLQQAKGKYIKFLFQDDVLRPECIAQLVGLIEKDTHIGLVCCKRHILTEMDNRFTQGWVSNFDDLQVNLPISDTQPNIMDGRALLNASFFKKKPINIIGEPVAVLFKKDLIAKVGFFDESFFQLVDYEYWLRFFKDYKLGFHPERLVCFRLHSHQASFKHNRDRQNDHDLYYKLLYKHYFWYLHPNFKWLLIKKYSSFFRMYRYFKRFFNVNT